MVDHIDQIDVLRKYHRVQSSTPEPWPLFIKLDLGSGRAGLRPDSSQLPDLMEAMVSAPAVKLSGIYSYPVRLGRTWSFDTATSVLREHISILKEVASLQPKALNPLIIAIGSSITARVVQSVDFDLPSHLNVEIVAGRSTRQRPRQQLLILQQEQQYTTISNNSRPALSRPQISQ